LAFHRIFKDMIISRHYSQLRKIDKPKVRLFFCNYYKTEYNKHKLKRINNHVHSSLSEKHENRL
jgi:hypothetical protein